MFKLMLFCSWVRNLCCPAKPPIKSLMVAKSPWSSFFCPQFCSRVFTLSNGLGGSFPFLFSNFNFAPFLWNFCNNCRYNLNTGLLCYGNVDVKFCYQKEQAYRQILDSWVQVYYWKYELTTDSNGFLACFVPGFLHDLNTIMWWYYFRGGKEDFSKLWSKSVSESSCYWPCHLSTIRNSSSILLFNSFILFEHNLENLSLCLQAGSYGGLLRLPVLLRCGRKAGIMGDIGRRGKLNSFNM